MSEEPKMTWRDADAKEQPITSGEGGSLPVTGPSESDGSGSNNGPGGETRPDPVEGIVLRITPISPRTAAADLDRAADILESDLIQAFDNQRAKRLEYSGWRREPSTTADHEPIGRHKAFYDRNPAATYSIRKRAA